MEPKLQPSTTYRAVLGKVLELQRTALNQNQHEFAAKLGASQSAWSRVETGQSSLAVEEFVDVAHALKTSPEELLRCVQRSVDYLQKRGVKVLMRPGKAADDSAVALLGAAALGGLLVAILTAKK